MRWVRLSAAASGLLIASLLAGTASAQVRSSPTLREANSDASIYPVRSALTSTRVKEQPPETVVSGDPVPADYVAGDGPYSGNFCDDVWGCCCCCCEAGVYAGAEATFLWLLDEPTQKVVLQDLVTNQFTVCESDPGLGSGFRTWAGLHCCGWGFRATWWHFDGDNAETEPSVPVKVPTSVSAFDMDLDVVDVELTQKMCLRCWRIYSSFGGRYASLQRTSTVAGFGTVGNGVDLAGIALGTHEVEGSGFTFSVGGARPVGCCCGWNVFWNFRGSLLWADTTAYALTDANAVTIQGIGQASAHSRDEAFAGSDKEEIFIAEVQAGLLYEHCLCCLPACVFFRAAVEYQYWNTGDLTAQTGSFAFLQGGPNPPFGGRVDATANAHDGDLNLLGVSVAAGLCY